MRNYKTQTATADDGTPKGMPKGQSANIEQMNNPTAMPNIKQNRNTGEVKKGTAFLRKHKNGNDM